MPVPDVVKDVVAYMETCIAGATLRGAQIEFSPQELRVSCMKLASWWGRGTLLVSRHPYLALTPAESDERLRRFLTLVPALQELVQCDQDRCQFVDSLTRDFLRELNEYVRENYRPRLMR